MVPVTRSIRGFDANEDNTRTGVSEITRDPGGFDAWLQPMPTAVRTERSLLNPEPTDARGRCPR
jgi:hypothetical protein